MLAEYQIDRQKSSDIGAPLAGASRGGNVSIHAQRPSFNG